MTSAFGRLPVRVGRFAPSLRGLLATLLGALAGVLLVGGCGDVKPGGPSVEILLSSVDGAGTASYRLRALHADGREGATYPLERVDGNVYEAAGAPDGAYRVEGEGGWGMLWPSTRAPDLRRDALEPTPIQMGRPYSIYVARESHDYRYTSEWAAFVEAPDPQAEPRSITLSAEVDDRGLAAVRVPKEVWGRPLTLFGRLESGLTTRPIPVPARDTPAPALSRGRPAEARPLRVFVFGGDGAPRDGVGVRVDVPGLPLPMELEGTTKDGVAAFAALPFLERPLRVALPASGSGAFFLDPNEWLPTLQIRLLLVGDDAVERRLHVADLPASVAVDSLQIQARPAKGRSYGFVPSTTSGSDVTLRLPPGDVRLLVRAGDRWAATRTPGSDAGGEWTLAASAFEEATRVSVAPHGASDGWLRLFRIEDDKDVLAQGLERPVAGDAEMAFTVPPGTYRFAWAHSRGEVVLPRTFSLAPGGQVRVPISAR